ncbi:zinc ribbon domain-containing protein [Demequina capsici]|uniref:C4-type zinc ribbon domain-containing protein n=1 Tax=Demequina capsici TaxID=3075620 RepID=A0AA96FA15_9MICO|nr:C4-type zinc ribbon domain-containing protein [Demequina sp. OYTSA14]WNM25547.1 C4-type zinc ribbon domain-containing protein [Demequina sp. OYTSA14]
MATAPAADQRRLLDVQDADLRAQQLRHKRDTLPQNAQLEELAARRADLHEERIARNAEVGDLRRAVQKAEDDVQAVRARKDRDQQRLDSGSGSAKDLQALQSELEVLGRRLSALEDVEIDAMEQVESAEAALASATEQAEALDAQVAQVTEERDAQVREIDGELVTVHDERGTAARDLDAGLLALYDKLREQHGGVGAAALVGGTCQGCHMSLNAGDLAAILDAPADRVVRCEECGRILVRGA